MLSFVMFSTEIVSFTLILPISRLQAHRLMTSRIMSPAYDMLVLLLH